MRLTGLALSLLLAASLAQAQTQMYKWIDAKGNPQYSNLPPPAGVKFEKVDIEPAQAASIPPAAAKSSDKSSAEIDLEFRRRQQAAEKEQKEEDKKAAEAKAKQDNCAVAQGRVKILTDGGRLLKPTTTGEREYMGDEEIAAELAKAQQNADEACK
jgi:hypothetical protein